MIEQNESSDLLLKKNVNDAGIYIPNEEVGMGPHCSTSLLTNSDIQKIPEEPLKPGEQYRFHFNMARCIGCKCCVVACNEQNNNPEFVNWRRVGEIEGGTYPETKRFYLSMACNHCGDPSCLTGCPVDAYVKDPQTGIVLQKQDACIGCQYCIWNCPYGVPQYNPERKIVTKCDLCYNRLKDGTAPACVAACPETAITVEKVSIVDWTKDHRQADCPQLPSSGQTLSTTRITLPVDFPRDALKADLHDIRPEKPHTPLIFLTVLTQLAIGGFFFLWLGDLFFQPPSQFLGFGASGMLFVTLLALSVSIFHLGRPVYAFRALKMWRRSWLSREVLAFSLFSLFGGCYALLWLNRLYFHWSWLYLNDPLRILLGSLASLVGILGITASAFIYMVPARPSWNTPGTLMRFFLTALILGSLLELFIYSLFLYRHPSSSDLSLMSLSLLAPIYPLYWITATSSAVQFLILVRGLSYLTRKEEHFELNATAQLLMGHFRWHLLIRLGCLILGGVGIPLSLEILFMNHSLLTLSQLIWVNGLAFLISLAGEFLGRYLFFVTVVPKDMPGGFFK